MAFFIPDIRTLLSDVQLTGFSTDPSEVCEAVKTTKPFLPGDGDPGRSGTVSSQPTGQWLLTKSVIHRVFLRERLRKLKSKDLLAFPIT